MSAVVRIFAHSGVSNAFVANYNAQQSFTGQPMLKQPYLARASVTATTSSAQATTAALTPAGTALLSIQVQPGKRVHYELQPRGQDARIADSSSPILDGNETLEAGPGWILSLIEWTAEA